MDYSAGLKICLNGEDKNFLCLIFIIVRLRKVENISY